MVIRTVTSSRLMLADITQALSPMKLRHQLEPVGYKQQMMCDREPNLKACHAFHTRTSIPHSLLGKPTSFYAGYHLIGLTVLSVHSVLRVPTKKHTLYELLVHRARPPPAVRDLMRPESRSRSTGNLDDFARMATETWLVA